MTANTEALDRLLDISVTAHLRVAGFRKSRHTYRHTLSNGDQAVISFRGFPVGATCSFLLDWWVTLEPCWDLTRFRPDGPCRDFPRRSESPDATMHRQVPRPPARAGAWRCDGIAEFDQMAHEIEDFVLDTFIPVSRLALDRSAVLDLARRGEPLAGSTVATSTFRGLLVDAGPSRELDAVLLECDTNDPVDQLFSAWAASRLVDGPVWKTMLGNL